MMEIDGRNEFYCVRERDNRVRVVLSQPGWAAKSNIDYWVLSIEDLIDSEWKHRPDSTQLTAERSYSKLLTIAVEVYACEANCIPQSIFTQDTAPTRVLSEGR